MRPPGSLHRLAVDDFRPGPSLRAAQHDHRPVRSADIALRSGIAYLGDPVEGIVEGRRHGLVHRAGLVALDEERLVAVSDQETAQFRRRHPREESRVGDLVAVEVEDRQDRAVADGIEEFGRVPGSRERSRLGLAVTDHAGDDQARVVERGPEGVDQGIAEFTALVDRSGQFGRGVAGDASGNRELAEETAHALLVRADIRIDLAVRPFEVGVGHQPRRAVAWPPHRHHVEVAQDDGPVEVGVDEIEAWGRAPVAKQARLHVSEGNGLAQQRVVEQVDLPDREVVRRSPVCIDGVEVGRS